MVAVADGGELGLRSVPELAVNSTNPSQASFLGKKKSCMSVSSVDLRLEVSTVIRFVTPC